MSEKEDKFIIEVIFRWDKNNKLKGVVVTTPFRDTILYEQIVELIGRYIEDKTGLKRILQRKSYIQ
jgi:hypothetical protein